MADVSPSNGTGTELDCTFLQFLAADLGARAGAGQSGKWLAQSDGTTGLSARECSTGGNPASGCSGRTFSGSIDYRIRYMKYE
jgi:hypothetical protein